MLYRKFAKHIEEHLKNQTGKILLVNGARQIGKSYIIRHIGKKLFKNYIEIDLKADKEGTAIFSKVKSTKDFYLQLSAIAGNKLSKKNDTLVFLDEIQSYPHILTMLKFLNQEARYTYIASGSQLGIALAQTPSVPIGSITIEQMYPLDFEEFLYALGCGQNVIDAVGKQFEKREPVSEALHNYLISQFKLYLLIGGMPDAVNTYIATNNIVKVRNIQTNIHNLYSLDASQYDKAHKLVIRKIYEMIPSNMENKKKRIIVKDIEDTNGHKQFSDYNDEWEYLINSGIALAVKAISNPHFPLLESEQKNLLKLYLNDVGILTSILYDTNINAILQDEKSINLGTVYESVVAQELHAHGFELRYYDNKKKGEVDFLVDDFNNLTVLPLKIKSGKDYSVHSALNNFIKNPEYNIHSAIVLCNDRNVETKAGITHMPIYYSMFLQRREIKEDILIRPIPAPPIV